MLCNLNVRQDTKPFGVKTNERFLSVKMISNLDYAVKENPKQFSVKENIKDFSVKVRKCKDNVK